MSNYLIEGQTLTNIADAIREKAGIASPIFPESMPSYIRSIQAGTSDTAGVPDDIVAEAERVTNGMIAKMGGNALTFVALSDMHELGDSDNSDAAVIERFRRSNKNAGQGAWLVSQKLPLDFCAFLGDYCYGSKNTTLVTSYYDWLDSMVAAKGYTAQVRKNTQMIEVPGNHDVLFDIKGEDGTYITNDLISGIIGSYRYVDIDSKKVRVVALNTAEYTAGYSSDGRMSGEQLQWFANALDLSGKADASNWGIIILAHHPLDWNGLGNAVGLLTAYINGTNYSVNHNGVAVSHDFTGKNAARVIAQFHGHTHCFRVDNIGDTSVKRVTIPNACFNRNNEYSTSSNQTIVDNFSEGTTYYKNDNKEGKNTAFCLVSIDLDEKTIYADCFGAGYDRVITYADKVVESYSITNNLTNVTNSNGAVTIVSGSQYVATLAPMEHCEMESVTVRMGGVDITGTAYNSNSGTITIGNVTGDIVITANAIKNVAYDVTNLVPTATVPNGEDVYNGKGYKDGYRISSAIGESAASGYVITGVMPYAENSDGTHKIIYIRGATLDTTNSNCRWTGLPSGQTATSSNTIQLNGGATNSKLMFSTYFTVEEIEKGEYYKMTPIESAFDSYSRTIGSMMMSLKCNDGANLIVTTDEPIE